MLISRNQSRRALVLVRIVFLLHASPSPLSMDDVPPPLEMTPPANMSSLSDVPRDVPPRPDVLPPPDAAAHPIAEGDLIATVRTMLPVVATPAFPHDAPRPTPLPAVHRYAMNDCTPILPIPV